MRIFRRAEEDGTIPLTETRRKIFLMEGDPALVEEEQIDLEIQQKIETSTQAQERGMVIPRMGILEGLVVEKAVLVANSSHVAVMTTLMA